MPEAPTHEWGPDLHYYTTRFVDGLRADIRAVVTLQRPDNFDTAYLLALLQEEVGESAKKFEFHVSDHGTSNKNYIRPAMPMPRPPPQVAAEKPVVKAPVPVTEDKMTALRSFRCARGLCDFCGEKWFRGHKCAPTIPLHAMQEIWDLFQLEATSDPQVDDKDSPDTPDEQLFLAISPEAQRGSHGCRTI